ncbi:MAG: tetratricopeptide repeat protein [Chthoniobacterales bacterium]|nr:tetratricopeptide repeat protein [Chthoniobacterales bacterium]
MGRKSARHKKQQTSAAAASPATRTAAPSGALIAAGLIAATLLIYAQVWAHQFISLDDDVYIRDNPLVNGGLTFASIVSAFTTFHSANWHPLTWLSHMLDVQLFGLHAGGHLLVNALLHAINSALLFFFLRRVTGSSWRSALVAALFALHPLHVESVAWASERKDTLSTFFGLLALLAYARYAEVPSWKRLGLVSLAFALGLMAKPMLVTLPFALLLLDYWPLRRWSGGEARGMTGFLRSWWPLLREKLALFALTGASMVITFLAQTEGGAVRALGEVPLSLRLANALVSYANYLLLTFWPGNLAVYYPFPGHIPAWQVIAAVALLLALTLFACLQARPRPYLLVGWFWFVGTLVPVIGLVQVGGQAMADRYHYLPSIGLFLALVFGTAELVRARDVPRPAAVAVALLVLLTCGTLTARQASRWRDSETLFRHTLAVTPDNLIIEYNLGYALGQSGRLDEAAVHFANVLRIDPNFFDGLLNMGVTRAGQGRSAEAIGFYERALSVQPTSAKAHLQLGLALVQQGRNAEALERFRRAAELAPSDADTRTNLGLMLARQGDVPDGMQHLREAVRLHPGSAEAHNNLGLVLFASGNVEESIPHFTRALELKPSLTVARQNLERARAQLRSR